MVGGFAYGELYEALRGDDMPIIDRPYVIVQLMILEASEAFPPEVLVERTGDVSVQPSRDLTVQAGDDLVFFARHDRVLDVVSRNVAGAAG